MPAAPQPAAAPAEDPPPREPRTREETVEREYVVLHRTREETSDDGEVWEIVRIGRFQTRQAALDEGYAEVGPKSAEDHEPRTLVAVPAHFFKPLTVRVETVKQVKWEG